MSSSIWPQVLISQLWSLPYLFAYVIGIGLSLIFWQRHPAVSLFASLGFLILFGTILLGVGSSVWFSMAQDGAASIDRGKVLQVLGVFRSILALIAYGFLITAIFGWRKAGSKQP